MEEGVEEEVSDAFPQGGRLDQGGRPDAGAGARGAEAQQDVVFPESPEVLPYRCGVVLKRYPEPHGQVTAYNRSPVH